MTMMIPARYQPEVLSDAFKEGWLEWSLHYFTEPVLQTPYLDITLQWDATDAYAVYRQQKFSGSSFFAFLLWHLAQTLAQHPSFNLRYVDEQWYWLRNPPVFVPVAVDGKYRFQEMLLEDVCQQDYPAFSEHYQRLLCQARNFELDRSGASAMFPFAHFIGNLPYLQFTGLTLHWRQTHMIGQSFFYFGKRYWQEGRLRLPMAAKLHHGCADPLVFNALLQDWGARFPAADMERD